MKVKGFINIYPSTEAGAGSSTSFFVFKKHWRTAEDRQRFF